MRMNRAPKEWDYIKNIRDLVRRDKEDTLIPLGDDAFAARPPSFPLVMAQDMMVENVHFRREFCSPEDLGHKALAVNLSDFAAMGATPRWAMVSLALPENLNKSWLDGFYRSMSELGDRFDVEIVGGDLCASPQSLTIDVSLIGFAQKPLSRQKAEAGDLLLCSGPLGLAAQGLLALRENKNFPLAIQKYRRPEPRLDLLPELQAAADDVHALIDVSDGLISESLHLTRQLELGLDLWSERIPLSPEAPDLRKALWGGEDYELLLAISPTKAGLFPKWKNIGRFTSEKQITLVAPDGKREAVNEFLGWQHFVSN